MRRANFAQPQGEQVDENVEPLVRHQNGRVNYAQVMRAVLEKEKRK